MAGHLNCFITQLSEIGKQLDLALSPDDFQEGLIDSLNTNKQLPREVKFRISKIIEQPLRIKFNSGVFAVGAKVKGDSWMRAKETILHEIQFEKLMADQESQQISDAEFENKVLDLLDNHLQLIYQASFHQRTILGVLLERGLEQCATEILDKKQPILLKKVKVGSNEVSLLEYLLNHKMTPKFAKNLLTFVGDQKISIQETGSDNKATYRDMFKRYLSGQDLPFDVQVKFKSKFLYFSSNNPRDVRELPYDKQVEEKLNIKILDVVGCKNQPIQGLQFQLELTCTNSETNILLKLTNSKLVEQFELIWLQPPPPNKEVAYFVADGHRQRIHQFTQDQSEKIAKEWRTTDSFIVLKDPPNEFVIRQEAYKVDLVVPDETDLSRSKGISSELGYLFWRPNYKKINEPQGQDQENADNPVEGVDDEAGELIADEPTHERIAGERIYPLFGILESFIDVNKQKHYTKGDNHEIYVKDAANHMYFDSFERKVEERVSQYLQEEGNEVVEIKKDAATIKAVQQALVKFNAAANAGKFRFEAQSATALKIVGLNFERVPQILAFVDYLCAVAARESTNQVMVVDDTEQVRMVRELNRDNKAVTFRKDDKTNKYNITGDIEALRGIAQIIVDDSFEEVFLGTPLLKAAALNNSIFQTKNDLNFKKIDDTHYEIVLEASKVNQRDPPASALAVEIEDEQRFKVRGSPKDMVFFTRIFSEYKQSEIDRQRAENKPFREERNFTKEELDRVRQALDGIPGIILKQKVGTNTVAIEGPPNSRQEVLRRVTRVLERMALESIEVQKNSFEEVVLKKMPERIVMTLIKRLNDEVAKLGTFGKFDSKVIQKDMTDTTVTIRLEQANPKTQQAFSASVDSIKNCFESYTKVLTHLSSLKAVLIGKEVKRLSVVKKGNKASQKDRLLFLRQTYADMLQKEFEMILKNYETILLGEVKEYIEKGNLKQRFTTKVPQQMEETFRKMVEQLNFFHRVQDEELQKLKQLQPKRGNAGQIEKCIRQTVTPLFDQLSKEFSKNALTIGSIMSAFQALKILIKTYYELDLPIVEHLTEFNRIFKENQLIVVKTGTGSGKSTVLPPYLIGLGMRKVFVTQPRRLPCSEIYRRVGSIYGQDMVGYMIAGDQKNEAAKLVYITDGLLKEKLYKNEDDLGKIDVIMLDEIHERSKNIDLILLLLLRKLSQHPNLKVILCSATVNDQIVNMFGPKIKHATFEVAIKGFPVTEHAIDEGVPILEQVMQLSSQLTKDTQMLVFFPSVKEVLDYTKLFKEKYKRNAFSLTGAQGNAEQQDSIENGQIFFSTSIAETSLTFPRLKFVVDSRISRIMCYDTQLQIMVSEEIPSSESSIKQRRGRLGRNCPGDYYYYQYRDMPQSPKHELTELQRIDLTVPLFEMLIKYDTVDEVRAELLKLKPSNPALFKVKFDYAVGVLDELTVINNRQKVSKSCRSNMMIFGNCGNPRFNVALHKASLDGCFENVAAIVAFAMMGQGLLQRIIAEIPGSRRSPDGDIETVGRFILDIANTIQLRTLDYKDIKTTVKNVPEFRNKPWVGTIVRIIRQLKKFVSVKPNTNSSHNWRLATDCLTGVFSNCVYLNKSLVGGNRNYFEKAVSEKKYGEIHDEKAIQYLMDQNSICYKRDDPSHMPFILSLFSTVNPFRECTLSFCSRAEPELVEMPVDLIMRRQDRTFEYTEDLMDDMPIFNRYYDEIDRNDGMKVKKDYPRFEMIGPFRKVFKRAQSIYKDITNNAVVIDCQKMFDALLDKRVDYQKANPKTRQIDPELVKQNFDQIDFYELFRTLSFEIENYFGNKLKFRNKRIILEKVRGEAVQLVHNRLDSFFKWFIDCRKVFMQEVKQNILQQPNEKELSKPVFDGICSRIEEIVDSERDYHLVKALVFGQNKRSARLCRMIAVCWVLVKRFDVIIKGGFVRDWIVNGKDEKDPTLNLANLLELNPRNGFYEVPDMAKITPSDIDVELSKEVLFNRDVFIQWMHKLKIDVEIADDGWRFHLVFDRGAPTGGFTADLIQPYCTISHDSFDFDVNIFYIKKDHLKQLGMKIPLDLEPLIAGGQLARPEPIHISLEQLILECRQMKMRRTRADIYKYRIDKFTNRGWKISEDVFSPVIYKTLKTITELSNEAHLNQIDPNWRRNMANAQIIRVEHLRNSSWDEGYLATLNWIRAETKNYNTNDKLLYHGTGEVGAMGIKENGFDSRYFKPTGYYGRGVYFADTPVKSHDYTSPNAQGCRYMFVVMVALGVQEHLTAAANNKLGPKPGCHSILGTAGKVREYIIERWGQAKPILLITYK